MRTHFLESGCKPTIVQEWSRSWDSRTWTNAIPAICFTDQLGEGAFMWVRERGPSRQWPGARTHRLSWIPPRFESSSTSPCRVNNVLDAWSVLLPSVRGWWDEYLQCVELAGWLALGPSQLPTDSAWKGISQPCFHHTLLICKIQARSPTHPSCFEAQKGDQGVTLWEEINEMNGRLFTCAIVTLSWPVDHMKFKWILKHLIATHTASAWSSFLMEFATVGFVRDSKASVWTL